MFGRCDTNPIPTSFYGFGVEPNQTTTTAVRRQIHQQQQSTGIYARDGLWFADLHLHLGTLNPPLEALCNAFVDGRSLPFKQLVLRGKYLKGGVYRISFKLDDIHIVGMQLQGIL